MYEVSPLLLTLGLGLGPLEFVGRDPDADVLHPLVVLEALLCPVYQVVGTQAPVGVACQLQVSIA